jgi:threonine dehydrogenase-like Zn-dependent dehydrogenase
MATNQTTMTGVVLPGNRTVQFREFPMPEPGPGQVLVKMKASSICGSDIRAIYREHLGKGPEAYQGVIAGHEPSGQIAKVGPHCREFKAGDRVVLYHIAGCGCCEDCMHGYMISCTSPQHRQAYGWQRNGGHADYCLAEENTCVHLPDNLTYIDGAFMACGFGTAWECLTRMNVSGRDRLLVTGLGPVGLAAAQLARSLGVAEIIGIELAEGRLEVAGKLRYRNDTPLVDHVLRADDAALANIQRLTGGHGCEVGIDCSGAASGRLLALRGTGQWGRCGFVGEGGRIEFDVSPFLIHEQITLYGSWVTSRKHLADLANHLARLGVHPESTCGARLPLAKAAEAYELADKGQTGKVCLVFDEENARYGSS